MITVYVYSNFPLTNFYMRLVFPTAWSPNNISLYLCFVFTLTDDTLIKKLNYYILEINSKMITILESSITCN